MKRIMILIILSAASTNSALAYIDPGTAGMIISGGIWPYIVTIFAVIGAFFLKFFFRPIKKGVLKVWEKIKRKY